MEEKTVKKSLDVMIDIETLSTNREKGMILSAAFQTFKVNPFDDSFEDIDASCEVFLNPTDSMFSGFVVDEGTMSWWSHRPVGMITDLRKNLKQNGADPFMALSELYGKLKDLSKVYNLVVWSKGTDFDFVLLENAFKRLGIIRSEDELPYKFWMKRDVRTVVDFAKRMHPDKIVKTEPAHGALADCKIQIDEVKQAYKILFNRE